MKEKTATQVSAELDREHQDRTRFERHVALFIERWEPKDVKERHAFNADLMSLMRTMQMDMQKPVIDTVAALLARLPPSPIFVEKRGD